MTNDIFIFDRNIIRQKRNRSAPYLKDHGFLIDWASNQIIERLGVIKKDFSLALQIGNRSSNLSIAKTNIEKIISIDHANKLAPNIIADEEALPFQSNVFDLVLSALNLHSTNDLPGTLVQIKNCLKDDGLFIGAMLGGETLHELRHIMTQVEIEQTGGQSPRVAPFADLPQMGALMQRAGFNLPVIDSEKITVSYDNVFKLMQDLRLMGESNSINQRRKKFTPRRFFERVNQLYAEKFSEKDGRITATFEVIFLLGWKPHDSQQKPLRPGSAQNRLSDALKTSEGKLPC